MPRLDLTLAEVRELAGDGEIVGDPDVRCHRVATLERAGPEELSFVKSRRFLAAARESKAGALLVPEPVDGFAGAQLVVADPAAALARILARIALEQRRQPAGVHPAAHVDPAAELGEGVTVGPGAVVREGARVGDRSVLWANAYLGQRSSIGVDSVLYPNAVVLEDVSAGDRLVVHAGAVIGAEGYGYTQADGRHVKIPQVGEIAIGDDVEIGALATVDRATIDRTTIGRGTKIGDLVHVAHNVTIGEDVLILPTVAISGSVTIGDRAILAGRAGTVDNISIGAGAVLAATSVAYKDVPEGVQMWGNPAREKSQQMRIQSDLARLPEMLRELRHLKKKLDERE